MTQPNLQQVSLVKEKINRLRSMQRILEEDLEAFQKNEYFSRRGIMTVSHYATNEALEACYAVRLHLDILYNNCTRDTEVE